MSALTDGADQPSASPAPEQPTMEVSRCAWGVSATVFDVATDQLPTLGVQPYMLADVAARPRARKRADEFGDEYELRERKWHAGKRIGPGTWDFLRRYEPEPWRVAPVDMEPAKRKRNAKVDRAIRTFVDGALSKLLAAQS